MAIWRLEPIDTTNHNWRASSYVGSVLIRAADEQRARVIATRAFGIAARLVAGMDVPVIPWDYDGLSDCSRANDTTFAEEGPDEILDPAQYEDEWRRMDV